MGYRLTIKIFLCMALLTGLFTGATAGQTSPADGFHLTAREGKAVAVELHWETHLPVDYFKVLRDGEPIAITATTFCPDSPASPEVTYQVEAWRGGKSVGHSAALTVEVPDRPIHEKPQPQVVSKRSGIRLSWPPTNNSDIVVWRVRRKPASTAGDPIEVGTVKASRGISHIFMDRPEAGGWVYTVTALNAAGNTGPAATIEAIFDPAQKPRKILDWPLTEKPEGVTITGDVAFTPEGALFSGGYIQTPHQITMNMDMGLTVEFEFRDESTANTPVLLSHGIWRGDGWFIQRLGGKLVARTSVGDSPSFSIERGKWYRVRMAYGGLGDTGADGYPRGIMSLDGKIMTDAKGSPIKAFRLEKEIDTGKIPNPVSDERPLVIGQYNAPGAEFVFRGAIRNLKIWDDYLENGDQ